ncbi:MAG: hypothetical protein RQ735_08855 [Flavobacteriaceae bacterium]|nr:hypothetical protein [Flavobacteriaceae bacterium]
MTKSIHFLFIFIFLVACNPVKQTEKQLLSGDYDAAIERSLEQLRKGKPKNYKSFVALLGDAFQKATQRDLDQIDYLSQQQNPEYFSKIFETYTSLKNRQDKIRPLLPLPGSQFVMNDYAAPIAEFRAKTSVYLLDKAENLLKTDAKNNARLAFDELSYIDRINPNYKNVRSLLDEARFKGTNFVMINFSTPSHLFTPRELMYQLEEIDLKRLNRKWTVFDTQVRQDFRYDYQVDVELEHIEVSPEQYFVDRTVIEKSISDGYKNLVDKNGNVVRDSLGKPIQVEKYVTVRCEFIQHNQAKAAHVGAKTYVVDLLNRQTTGNFRSEGEVYFENVYAEYRGDKRVLDNNHWNLINNRPVPFPTNNQMIYDATEMLKDRLVSDIKNLTTFR